MPVNYRTELPQLGPDLFLTDGGLETTLVFQQGIELPDFAAFGLLATAQGEATLRRYFETYVQIAKRFARGFVLETVTWRANPDWGTRLGYSTAALADVNRKAVWLLEEIRRKHESDRLRMVISGCVGPRGDGYVVEHAMSAAAAEAYHAAQVETFASTAADMVSAITMNYADEATGIARAAQGMAMPVAISFTVETDGNLPTGQSLEAAIGEVDDATGGYPGYYMVNCAHPTHFERVLAGGGAWCSRIGGVRANASTKSHAELNESTALDSGDPVQLGRDYGRLLGLLPRLRVLGGCCGTDHRHVEQIAAACAPQFGTPA